MANAISDALVTVLYMSVNKQVMAGKKVNQAVINAAASCFLASVVSTQAEHFKEHGVRIEAELLEICQRAALIALGKTDTEFQVEVDLGSDIGPQLKEQFEQQAQKEKS